MKVGILAAGEGTRLRAAGFARPKPLLCVAGMPLIGHLLRSVSQLGAEEIVCIINTQGEAIPTYARQAYPTLPLIFIQQDTSSSFESFQVLCAHLHGSPFLITTVDTVFAPACLPAFVAAARQQIRSDMMLTLTTFIDDEKPLYVRLDAQQHIVALGDAAHGSGYVTSGLYYCAPTVSAACLALAPGEMGALREFLRWLLQQGYSLRGYLAPQMIDVDRPQDIAVAEQFLQQLTRGTALSAEESACHGIC